ncbi:MAG: pectate lyase [Verrucomicrobia bacterium]|nr:pectate lyase [Verrucomicrobiota bacterium]
MRSALALLALPLFVSAAPPLLPSFPGAEGYGRFAKGGRGGDVYMVTNLNDSGEGSLREAIRSKAKGTPRTVVFAVAGTIKLKKTLQLEEVHGLTLAGQTAPGGGIALRDHGVEFRRCSDLIVRHLRFRLGDKTKTSEDVIGFGPEEGTCRDVILDHVTATWGIDGIMDVYAAERFTMQWCLFGEALNDSTHYKKEPHAMLMSFRKIKGNISIHHNLLFSSRDRHPTLGGYPPPHSSAEAVFDFRNNVIYNWEGSCNLATGRFNLVANYWRPGPDTDFKRDPFPIAPKAEAQNVTTGFLGGNFFEWNPAWTADNSAAFQWGTRGGKYIGEVTREKFTQPGEVVPEADRPHTRTASAAYDEVLQSAGANRPRDAADRRVIAGVKDRSHRRIDSQDEVGGWPELESGMAAPDTDRDGMPNAWETKNGLNPNDPADRNLVRADGYTQLEHYLHERAGDA